MSKERNQNSKKGVGGPLSGVLASTYQTFLSKHTSLQVLTPPLSKVNPLIVSILLRRTNLLHGEYSKKVGFVGSLNELTKRVTYAIFHTCLVLIKQA